MSDRDRTAHDHAVDVQLKKIGETVTPTRLLAVLAR